MTIVWRSDPSFKVEISGETFIDDTDLTIVEKRVENNLSYLVLQVDDYKSKNYVDVFDTFDSLTLSLRYGSDSWSKVFTGNVTTAKPHLSMQQGEVLEVGAWGEGKALLNTCCDESYGLESIDNSAVDTPKEIIDDLITNHINKEFGGAASGYAIVSEVDNVHAGLSVTHLNSPYSNNFVMVNKVCDLATAFAAATPSIHWFVDPDKNLMVKEIDQDHTSGDWDRYYGGSQANATIEVAKDMILYDFAKNVENYANAVILSSKFRMPSEDYWTEDSGGAALWDVSDAGGGDDITLTDDATSLVGSHSLKFVPTAVGPAGTAWYPAAKNASWDFTKCGSQNTIPKVCFYGRRNQAMGAALRFRLYSAAGNYVTAWYSIDSLIGVNDKWVYIEFPIGPYAYLTSNPEVQLNTMIETGTVDWSDVDWIEFGMRADATDIFYLDDLHFTGVIVREARDTSEITAHDLVQQFIRNDTAVNDSLVAATDTGTAAQLCYAELLRRSQTPIVGMIQIPLLVDLLPGQTLHIHACKKADGTFRINKDMRVKDLRHIINANSTPRTIVNLTDDVTNTHAFGVPTRYALLKQHTGALKNSEARNLKGGAVDNQIPRLSVNY